jgi:hypothetical protein
MKVDKRFRKEKPMGAWERMLVSEQYSENIACEYNKLLTFESSLLVSNRKE